MSRQSASFSVRDIGTDERGVMRQILGEHGRPAEQHIATVFQEQARPMLVAEKQLGQYLAQAAIELQNSRDHSADARRHQISFFTGVLLYIATFRHVNRATYLDVDAVSLQKADVRLSLCDANPLFTAAQSTVETDISRFHDLIEWMGTTSTDPDYGVYAATGAGILHLLMRDSDAATAARQIETVSSFDPQEAAFFAQLQTDPDLADLRANFESEGFGT